MEYNFSLISNKIKNNKKVDLISNSKPDIYDFYIIHFIEGINIKDIRKDNYQIVFDAILKQNNNIFTVNGGYSFNLLSLCCAYRPDLPEYIFDYLASKMDLKNNEKNTNYLLKKAINNKRNVNIEKGSFENSFLLYEKFNLTPLKSRKSRIFNYYFEQNINRFKIDITPIFLKLINFNFENDIDLFNPYSHTNNERNINAFNNHIKDYILRESYSGFSNPKLKAIGYNHKIFNFLKNEIDYHILFDYHNTLLNEYSAHIVKAPMDSVLNYFLSIDDYEFQKNKALPMTEFFHSVHAKRFYDREKAVQNSYTNSYLAKIRLEEKIKIKENLIFSSKNEDEEKIPKKRI